MPLPKIPSDLLEKLKCSVCSLHLSMSPVSIREDGKTTCNRCTKETAQSVIRCHLYEQIASMYTFPCRYQSVGCPKYLEFNKTEEHERDCQYGIHNRTDSCPVSIYSTCKWKGPSSLLCEHYETEHPELYLKDFNFNIKINADQEAYRLLKLDDILLLLQTKCDTKQDKLWFNMVYLSIINNASLIQYSIKLNSEDEKRVIELENENPFPVATLQLVPEESLETSITALASILKCSEFIHCQWNITVSKELKDSYRLKADKKKLLNIKNEAIKCPCCKSYMSLPIFCCPEGHIICVDCKGFQNECVDCGLYNVEFSRADNLERLAKSTQFSCKWKMCEQALEYDKIRKHERACDKRIYKCPCCDQMIGMLPQVWEHFYCKHNGILLINGSNSSQPFNVEFKNQDIFIFVHREIVRVQVNIIKKDFGGCYDYVEITIYHYCSPSFSQHFKYELSYNYCPKYNFFSTFNCHTIRVPVFYLNNIRNSKQYLTLHSIINENACVSCDFPPKSTEACGVHSAKEVELLNNLNCLKYNCQRCGNQSNLTVALGEQQRPIVFQPGVSFFGVQQQAQLFGASAPTQAPVFGNQQTPSVFGGMQAKPPNSNVFGAASKPGFATQVPNATGFGSQSSSAMFGSPSSANVFGAQSNTTGFSPQSSATAFGAQPSPAAFGAQSSSAAFGAQPSSAAFGAQTSSAAFGAPSSATAFGSQSSAIAFGAQPSSAAFGSQTSSAALGAQSSSAAFGAQPSSAAFGAQTSSAAFGAPSSATAFGTQSSATAFGASSQPNANVSGAQSNQSTFGIQSNSKFFGAQPKAAGFNVQQPTATSFTSFGGQQIPHPCGVQAKSNVFGAAPQQSNYIGKPQNSTTFGVQSKPNTFCEQSKSNGVNEQTNSNHF